MPDFSFGDVRQNRSIRLGYYLVRGYTVGQVLEHLESIFCLRIKLSAYGRSYLQYFTAKCDDARFQPNISHFCGYAYSLQIFSSLSTVPFCGVTSSLLNGRVNMSRY